MTKSRTRVIRFRVNEDEQILIDRLHERYSDFHGDTSKLIRALLAWHPELVGALEEMVPFMPTEGEMLDYASLNEGRAGRYGVLSEKVRRVLAKTKEMK